MSSVAPPALEDEQSLFSLATEYLEAAEILIRAPVVKVNVSLVIYFLLGHAGELFLKSFLFKNEVSIDDLKNKLGHDLAKLIQRARSAKLSETVVLAQLKALSKYYAPKKTEYRQLIATDLPPREVLLQEVRALGREVFNHVGTFTNGA